jgi:ABC-2 type transport system ATP-binding protein
MFMLGTEPHASAIRLQQVVKCYGPVQAVGGVDLAIDPGETVALLGPNGAGKSTTIDMILGLAQPDSGSVTLFGQPPSAAVTQGRVGGMLQTGSLLPHLTVGELVTMVASLYPHPMAVEETLQMTSTAGFADRRTRKLSGGQAQRVRLALALVGDPDLLVLDEPTAALDVESRREFWRIMRGVAENGKTVLFATHYLEEADAYADRIILMAGGRVVADGSSTTIKAATGGRTIRATLPGAERQALYLLPGVQAVDVHGETVLLACRRPDEALRAFLDEYPNAYDIEVKGAALEDAFVELTATNRGGTGPAASSSTREAVYR